MFESLVEKLEHSFKILKGQGKITEINVAETLKDVRRALLDADVNYKVVKEFIKEIHDKALGQDVLKSLTPGQQVVKIVRDELQELLGGDSAPLTVDKKPFFIKGFLLIIEKNGKCGGRKCYLPRKAIR